MTDIVDSKRRSELMARIRGRNTAPELAARCIAHRMGLRFQLRRKDLPGRSVMEFSNPGIVIPPTRPTGPLAAQLGGDPVDAVTSKLYGSPRRIPIGR